MFGAHVATGATLWPRRLKSLLGMGVATFRLVAALLTILGVWINLDTFFYLRSKQGYDAVTDVFGANRPRRPNSQPTIPQSQIQIEPTGLDHKIFFKILLFTEYLSNIILWSICWGVFTNGNYKKHKFLICDKNHYYALENTNLSAGNSCLGMSLCVTYPI